MLLLKSDPHNIQNVKKVFHTAHKNDMMGLEFTSLDVKFTSEPDEQKDS